MPGPRVLMIAHHFPPAAGSGPNRALAFARYLPEYGWEPLVVTPDVRWASPRDDGLLADVPGSVRVIRTSSFEPTRSPSPALARGPSQRERRPAGALSRRERRFRSHIGHLKRFPDAHIGWLPFALAAASTHAYDVAYSSSGPYTSHLVGLLLKRIKRKPWVAELRDGWYCWNRAIFPDYPGWRNVLERRLEALTLKAADRVVLVTDRMAAAFRRQYPDLPADHFAVLPNGFDPRQFPTIGAPSDSGRTFEVLHSGALYYGRSMSAFLDAVRKVCQRDQAFSEAFRLTLLGTFDDTASSDVREHGLGDRVRIVGQVDHTTALAAMRTADALLLVANTTPGAEATVPGKLFEYLAVGKPVLAIAPKDSSTADVLDQTGGGWLAPADDSAAIACVVQRAFAEQRGGRSKPADPVRLARFDRRTLAGDLAAIFDQVHARRS